MTTQFTHILGIDPSQNATGFALYSSGGSLITSCVGPITEASEIIKGMLTNVKGTKILVCIEKIPSGSFIVKGGRKIRAFREAKSAATQIKALIKSLLPRRNVIHEVPQQTWRAAMYKRFKVQDDFKQTAIEYCKVMGLGEFEDHNQAEAVVIGLYGVSMARVILA